MTDSDTTDIASLQEVIEKYPDSGFPVDAPEPRTLMDIAGFPNWENVYSNILAFFLYARGVHGFGTLFIHAILGAYHYRCPKEWEGDAPNPEDVEITNRVEREASTGKGRIDILVECPNFHLCIENKIWSPLHNDLGDYRKHCEKNKSKVLGIVLGPYLIKEPNLQDARFVSITYGDLVEQVRQRMGSYIGPQNTRYQYLLFDFLEQANRFTKTMNDNQRQFLQFWRDNEAEISNIYANCDQMRGEMKKRTNNHLAQCLEKLTESEKKIFESFPWNARRDDPYDDDYYAVFHVYDINEFERIEYDTVFHPLRIAHWISFKPPSSQSERDVIASHIKRECGFKDYKEHSAWPTCIIIKESTDSPLKDSVCQDAVETSVSILRVIAKIRSAG